MEKPVTVCGLNFKFSRDFDGKRHTYFTCAEVGLTLEISYGYMYPCKVYPTKLDLYEKDGPPDDFYKGDKVTGFGESPVKAMEMFFTRWNKRLPSKLKELRAEVDCLEDFDTKFKKHAKVFIEPTMEELKAEVQALKAKLAEKDDQTLLIVDA